MDKISKIILFAIPMTICNLRCRYCYLTQRDKFCTGEQIKYEYSPEHFAKAISKERIGGIAYANFCADGETLLVKDIDKYIYAYVSQGHYAEIVTNLTITSVLDKILKWDDDILSRITFKCSFHYIQLKERNLLDVFAQNVNKIWARGCSANIEMLPDDELIPYIEEIKEFSIKNFGALPHLTIARDDKNERSYLTSLSIDEYDKIWGQFDSDFWKFKKTIINVKREEYCCAGKWSLQVNLATGRTSQCYMSDYDQNIFEDLDKPIKFVAIGKCKDYHCYNGHALLTLGCIPNITDVRYGNIRDRIRPDGSHWIQENMRSFLNSQLVETHGTPTDKEKKKDAKIIKMRKVMRFPRKCIGFVARHLKIK